MIEDLNKKIFRVIKDAEDHYKNISTLPSSSESSEIKEESDKKVKESKHKREDMALSNLNDSRIVHSQESYDAPRVMPMPLADAPPLNEIAHTLVPDVKPGAQTPGLRLLISAASTTEEFVEPSIKPMAPA